MRHSDNTVITSEQYPILYFINQSAKKGNISLTSQCLLMYHTLHWIGNGQASFMGTPSNISLSNDKSDMEFN
jgi:hypothetical protein